MTSTDSLDDISIVSIKDKKKRDQNDRLQEIREIVKKPKTNSNVKKINAKATQPLKNNVVNKNKSADNKQENAMKNTFIPIINNKNSSANTNIKEDKSVDNKQENTMKNTFIPIINNKNSSANVNNKEDKSVVSDNIDFETITIQINDQNIEYKIGKNENFVNLYKFLFGDNKQSKLVYKNTIVSKFTTLAGINYDFNEKNNFTVKGDVIVKVNSSIEIKVNVACNKSFTVEVNKNDKFSDLLKTCKEKHNIENRRVFINGKFVKEDEKISDLLEEHDVIDLISLY